MIDRLFRGFLPVCAVLALAACQTTSGVGPGTRGGDAPLPPANDFFSSPDRAGRDTPRPSLQITDAPVPAPEAAKTAAVTPGDTNAPAVLLEDGAVLADAPLLVIHFLYEAPDYRAPLEQAMQAALDERPGAAFMLVGVTPETPNAARAALNGAQCLKLRDEVAGTLREMGLETTRLRISTGTSSGIAGNEVRIYLI